MRRRVEFVAGALLAGAAAGCAGSSGVTTSAGNPVEAGAPGAATVKDRLLASPRHGEWAMIRTGPNDSVRAWVVYP